MSARPCMYVCTCVCVYLVSVLSVCPVNCGEGWGGDAAGPLNFWMGERSSSPSCVTTSSPKFLTLCFFPPHVVSFMSLRSLSILMALADALRKKLEHHTRWACNSSRGLFLLEGPLPSRFLHLKLNPFFSSLKLPLPPNHISVWSTIPRAPRLLGWTARNSNSSLQFINFYHDLLPNVSQICPILTIFVQVLTLPS